MKGKGMLALVLGPKGKGSGAGVSDGDGADVEDAADVATDAGEVNEGQRAAAESLVAAIKSGDIEGVTLALKDFYDNC